MTKLGYVSNVDELIKLGWIDEAGHELSWKFWTHQRKRYPFVWVPDEEELAELDDKSPEYRRLFNV